MTTDIVLLGDSHLALSSGNGGAALAPLFARDFPGIRLTNLAEGGADSNYGLETISHAPLPPSFTALVLFGSNDVASWKGISLPKFVENYTGIITALKTKGAGKIIVITPPPVKSGKGSSLGRSNEDLIKYAQSIKNLAGQSQVACIDLFSILTQEMKTVVVHDPDCLHLNSAGYDVFFSQIKKELS
jgi:lysophospholipase L1-like esterase